MMVIDNNKVCPKCGGYGDGRTYQNCGFIPENWTSSAKDNENFTLIEAKGFWNEDYLDATGSFSNTAAIGVYDGTFNDDHIFYWFDDEDQVIGNQGDFTIESYEIGA